VAGSKFKTSLKMTGPFFAHDPAKTFRENAHEMMLAIAREGAADVRGQMAAGNSGRKPIRKLGDHVSDHIRGELRARPRGPNYTAFVFVENRGFTAAEGKSLMAAASSVEGRVHAVRKTKGRISRSRAVNVNELLKGIA
jgi:hypothetical protein